MNLKLFFNYEQGRLTSLTDGAEKLLIGYTYTASGRLKEIQTQNGFVASYEYDDDGNRTGKSGVRLGVAGAHQEIHISYQYDCMGRLTEERRGDHGEWYSYYLRARYYNPVVGRFTQEDTYRGDGLNLYAYCENNPVLYYDPNLTWEQTIQKQIDKGLSGDDI